MAGQGQEKKKTARQDKTIKQDKTSKTRQDMMRANTRQWGKDNKTTIGGKQKGRHLLH
jgi:hypothetical protein